MRILKARFVALAFNPDFFFDKWKSHHFSAICQAWFHARLQTHRGWVKTWFLRWRNMISNGFENGYYPRLSMIIYGFNWIIQDLDYPRLSNWHIPKFNWIIQDYPHFAPFWIAMWEVILTNHVYTGIWVINHPWLESISEMGVSSPVISWFMTPLNLRYIYIIIYIYTP